MSGYEGRTLVEDLLANGIDDLVYEAWVYTITGRSGLTDPTSRRQLAIGMIAEVLASGLMVAGEFDGAKHQQWEVSTGAEIMRITEDWLRWGDQVPTPGSVVWLALTPAGREVGEAVLARESG